MPVSMKYPLFLRVFPSAVAQNRCATSTMTCRATSVCVRPLVLWAHTMAWCVGPCHWELSLTLWPYKVLTHLALQTVCKRTSTIRMRKGPLLTHRGQRLAMMPSRTRGARPGCAGQAELASLSSPSTRRVLRAITRAFMKIASAILGGFA